MMVAMKTGRNGNVSGSDGSDYNHDHYGDGVVRLMITLTVMNTMTILTLMMITI
jgi:hypothetical protein